MERPFQPHWSISQPAASFSLPSGCAWCTRFGNCSSSAAHCAPLTTGFLKKLPALPIGRIRQLAAADGDHRIGHLLRGVGAARPCSATAAASSA
jgi:hypothetical protein